MGNAAVLGFSDFQQTFLRQYAPIVGIANGLMGLENTLFQKPVAEPLHERIRYIARTIANSFSALLILVSNGCGTDALKIARGMFESAVAALYLKKHPELLDDYLNFRWVKQHKYLKNLKERQPDQFKKMRPEIITEVEAEYRKVELNFTQKPWLKNDWCKDNLRQMAKDVGHEETYDAIYPLASSVQHLDIVGLVAQTSDDDVDVLPSSNNIELAISNATWGLFVALDCYNGIAALGMDREIEAMFEAFKTALTQSQVTPNP